MLQILCSSARAKQQGQLLIVCNSFHLADQITVIGNEMCPSKHPRFAKKQMSNFHPLEVVGRCSET